MTHQPEGVRQALEGVLTARLRRQLTDGGTVARSDPDLTAAALAAVTQWTYEPMRLNGVPVACDATIVLEFGAQ